MRPREFSSRLIDACVASAVVEDYELDIRENVVVKARAHLSEGFIEEFERA